MRRTSSVVAALAGIRRSLIGGFRTRRGNYSGHKPHIGAKERARHAGKPDGDMHTTPHPVHSNAFKRLMAAAKPARKPRAKKAAV